MIIKIDVLNDDLNHLLNVWEQSVRANNPAINATMIDSMRPIILTSLASMDEVYVYENHRFMQGFVGVLNNTIKMLYISPDFRNQEVASSLVREIIKRESVVAVDIPETNLQEKMFYENLGFVVQSLNVNDSSGHEIPMFHLEFVRR